MGEVPEWYAVIRAAKYLWVAPWELLDAPVYWKQWAVMAENAEAEASKQKEASQARKKR